MSEIRPIDSASNVSSSVSTQKPKSIVKSIVWDHFKVYAVDKNKAICSHCPKRKNEFSYNNFETQNLFKHLKTQHSFVCVDPKQPTIAVYSLDATPGNYPKCLLKNPFLKMSH
jgi:hypothetical protein